MNFPIHDRLAAEHLLDTCDWDAALAEHRAEMDADWHSGGEDE